VFICYEIPASERNPTSEGTFLPWLVPLADAGEAAGDGCAELVDRKLPSYTGIG
jgi:hypothetical protein